MAAATGEPGAPHLAVEGVNKYFGRFAALREVDFAVGKGEFVTILGPSGCGKTTILRIVAGLEKQTTGRVSIGGQGVSLKPVSKRGIGIVFQSYALLPNLSAEQNAAYGLSSKRMDSRARKRRARELMDLIGLAGMGGKFPAQLSGGQQQRVALARAMALQPKLLPLGEPLSALDAKARMRLRGEIRQLQQRLSLTTLMATHDQEEALTMADRILVMNQGRLAQYGTPDEVCNRPATPFMASFSGTINFIEGAAKLSEGIYRVGEYEFATLNSDGFAENQPASLAIRPEEVMLTIGKPEGLNLVPGKIRELEYRGSSFRISCALPKGIGPNTSMEVETPTEKLRRLDFKKGQSIQLKLPPDQLMVYPAPSANQAACAMPQPTAAASVLPAVSVAASADREKTIRLVPIGGLCLWMLAVIVAPLYALLSKSMMDAQDNFLGLANFVEYFQTPAR